ncbi:MAG: TonB-dependent receptor domain-containing protein [Mangrovibacterium sp.]
MLKKILILVLMIFNTQVVIESWAETAPATDAAAKAKVSIKGNVFERDSNLPMPYVNVAIYNSSTDALINGNITNDNGEFNIENIAQGTYYVKVNFIGFQEFKVNNVKIDGTKKVIDLGKLTLANENTELEGVEIVADKQRIQYKVDKKVVNVSQDINAAGGTAVDVLENTPSVQVDVEGNVTVRGSSNFTVLIDGRPTALDASDALQQIPASALENIEIITNPSAKYDPDGMGGILNLVTKKDALNGFDGIINVMAATDESKSVDFTLNHRNSKRLFTFGADFNERAMLGNGDIYRETYANNLTSIQDTKGERNHIRGGYSVKFGTDLYLSDLTTLGFNAQVGKFKMEQEGGGTNLYIEKDENKVTTNEYSSKEDEEGTRNSNYVTFTSSLSHNFNKEKTHKLDASIYYRYRDGDDGEVQKERLFDDNGNLLNTYLLNMTSVEGENQNEIRANADYTRPIGANGKLEAGYQARIRNEEETYKYTGYNSDGDLDLSNAMDFKRQIHALYSTYTNSWGKLSYMAGLRGEYTYRVIEDADANRSVIDRLDLFPSAHVSYDLSANTQLMTSYSKRIDRPRGWDLNPFESYMNQTTIRKGNPNLTPEYTNSFDFGLMQKFGMSFLSLEAFYRSTKDKIDHISSLREDGVMLQQVVNSGDDKSFGGEIMANVEATKWLTVNGNISVYRYMLSSEVNGVYVDKTSTNTDAQLSATFKFSKASRLQIMGNYRGPSVSAQGDRESSIFTNMSYKHDFLKNKLSATLSVQDIFATGGWKGTSSGEGFYQTFDFSPKPRVVQLTLSYKLNNYKEKRAAKDDNEMDFGGSSQSF